MPENICYAWGHSSLGDFLAAASDRGLVAFEFADRDAASAEVLRVRFPSVRFPSAIIEEDVARLSDTIGKLAMIVDHPECDPGLTLDIRGSDYEKRVWGALREIRAGETASYGDIAATLGAPGDARDVAEACAANPIAILIPCHRVVKKDGSLSGYRWGFKRKRALLAREHNNSTFQLA